MPVNKDIFAKIRGTGHPGQTDEEVLDGYKAYAPDYDKDLIKIGYQGPSLVADRLCKTFDKTRRHEIRVLDIGAGTGLVGSQIRQSGFQLIDALDPSVDMLAEAKKQGIYDHFFYEYVTGKPTSIKENTYDAVVGSGIFGHCHVPTEALYEMIRIIKPGGRIILVTRHELIHTYPQYKNLEPTMDELENSGIWRKIERAITPSFYDNKEAILWHYQKL